MTARALRVGVVLGGNLVEERTFADAGPITIGQSLRCRLSIPVDGVPHEHALFVRDQGRLLLILTGKMTGRVAQGGAIQTDLVGSIPIERGARGKLAIGDATILFQEVAMPVLAPRPQLPASVRGTFADRIDKRLALIVGGSLFVHLAIGAWAWMTDSEHEPLLQSKQFAEYRQDTYMIDMPDETAATAQEPGAATPVAPVQTPAPIVKPSRITTPSSPEPAMTTGDAERFAQILTGTDEQRNGRNEMGKRLPGAELGTQIADIRDNNRRIGNDDGGFRTREREGLGDGRTQIVDEVARLEQQRRREENIPRGRIDLRPPKQPPGDGPSPDGIIVKIQSDYMPGLMRCYQQGLRGDPSLRGKVAVTFTVTETGKVTDPTARGMTSEVDACITAQMATWRFAAPKDKDGDPTDLDLSLSLALVPAN